MADTQQIRFGDLYSIPSKNGVSKPSKIRGDGYPMVNMGEIFKYDRIKDDTIMELVPLTLNELQCGMLQYGDLLFARQSLVLEGAGKCSIFLGQNKTTFESHLIRVRLKKEYNPLFYYYYFSSKIGKQKIQTIVNQVSAAGIKGSDLKNLILPFFDYAYRNRIAALLSKYDDLIEINEKRIKMLEEMAQRLYTEWFVHFRFPGHEKVKMMDSGTEFGMIPEGWEVKKIKDICQVITGKTPSTDCANFYGGDILFIKTPDVHNHIFILDTEQKLTKEGSHTQRHKLLPKKTVFVSCIGTLGVVGITAQLSQTNQQINALLANDIHDYCMFYLFAKTLKNKLNNLGQNGATMGNVNKNKFENINILYPEESIRLSFFNFTDKIFDEILNLEHQKRILICIRDLLTQQLITGKRSLKE